VVEEALVKRGMSTEMGNLQKDTQTGRQEAIQMEGRDNAEVLK
jgi:hypothetical protein